MGGLTIRAVRQLLSLTRAGLRSAPHPPQPLLTHVKARQTAAAAASVPAGQAWLTAASGGWEWSSGGVKVESDSTKSHPSTERRSPRGLRRFFLCRPRLRPRGVDVVSAASGWVEGWSL